MLFHATHNETNTVFYVLLSAINNNNYLSKLNIKIRSIFLELKQNGRSKEYFTVVETVFVMQQNNSSNWSHATA